VRPHNKSCFPATLTSWQGNPPVIKSKSGKFLISIFVISQKSFAPGKFLRYVCFAKISISLNPISSTFSFQIAFSSAK